MPFLVACLLVLVFFFTDLVNVFIEHVHVAGIKIEPLVERDLDIDRGHIILLDRSGRGALPAAGYGHRLNARIRHKQHVLAARAVLMHHGGRVVHAGVDALHLRIMAHVLHDALMLLLDHRGALALAGHGVFDDRLSFELLRPGGQLMIHRLMGR